MRNRKINKIDRLELEDIEFHKKVRSGYLQIAAEEPDRIRVVNASGSVEGIHKKIVEILESVWL
ncbi:MAG: hypothetical protein Q8N09_11885 [Thermodesulfovibrionia bacterium]|nr:hypothetical protein [Thermodesulfovibrionia bacterium]